jgi:hypothetical protein
MQSQPETPSLHRKLTEVMAAVDWQKKTGRNTQQNYAFVTAEQIKDAVRGPLAEKRVMVYTSVKSVERTEWQTKSGTTMFSATIHGEVTFADGDSGEMFTVEAAGEGMDSGDKALNKAQTAMVKYALINTFLIPTGDDPEADSPEVARRANKPAEAPRTPVAPRNAPDPTHAPVRSAEPTGGSIASVSPTSPRPASVNAATSAATTPDGSLSDEDWAGLIPGEAKAEPLGQTNGNGHTEGLSARDLFARLEKAGVDKTVAGDAARKLFGKWKLTDLTDEQRAAVGEEVGVA